MAESKVPRETPGARPSIPPRVFLDIGAHVGKTLNVAMHKQWGFDEIHCFEPASHCARTLSVLAGQDRRIHVHNVALWNVEDDLDLHGAGGVGASLFASKPGIGPETERVYTVDTVAYLDDCLPNPVDLFVKVNVEGAEPEVLDGIRQLVIATSGRRICALYAHIDADKIGGHEARAAAARSTLAELQPKNRGSAAFFGKNVTAKTKNWLRFATSGPVTRLYLLYVLRPLHSLRLWIWRARHTGRRSS